MSELVSITDGLSFTQFESLIIIFQSFTIFIFISVFLGVGGRIIYNCIPIYCLFSSFSGGMGGKVLIYRKHFSQLSH